MLEKQSLESSYTSFRNTMELVEKTRYINIFKEEKFRMKS